MWIHHVSLEKHLPHWLGTQQLQWLPWAYALFQIVRTNQFFLLFISCLPFRVRKRGKNVVMLMSFNTIADEGLLWDYHDREEEDAGRELCQDPQSYFSKNPPTTFTIVERDPAWPPDWYALEFQKYFYFINTRALHAMCKWISACGGNEENVIFLERLHSGHDVGNVLSRKDAYHKMFSGKYCLSVNDEIDGALIDFVEINSKLWGVLSTVPALLQAAGANRTSMLLSLVIIALDLMGSRLHQIYSAISVRLIRSLKLGYYRSEGTPKLLFQVTALVYYAASMLDSVKFGWGDQVKDDFYMVGAGEQLNMQPFSRVKRLDSLRITGGGHYDPLEEKSFIRIWDGRGLAMPMYMKAGDMYAIAHVNEPVFVE